MRLMTITRFDQDRNTAEQIIIQQVWEIPDSFETHVFDCGRLGVAVVTFSFVEMEYTVEWLPWTRHHTLNVPGLDIA